MVSVVAVIGCGSIGMRHVEALGRLRGPVRVYAVDMREDAVLRAKSLFEAARAQSETAAEVLTLRTIEEIPNQVDLAIVATAAQGRLELVSALLRGRQVNAMILEKFLFPRTADYAFAGDILGAIQGGVWVNCPRRLYPSYREIAKRVHGAQYVGMRVSGRASVTPIGAIAIHFADLLAFLGQDAEIGLSATAEDISLLPTRRGVDDFAGVMCVHSADGRLRLRYTAATSTEAPQNIYIDTDKAQWVIQEWCQAAYMASPETSWRFEPIPFAVPYQSQLTNLVAEEILTQGRCDLPTFAESAKIHLSLMAPLLESYRTLTNNQHVDAVPFT